MQVLRLTGNRFRREKIMNFGTNDKNLFLDKYLKFLVWDCDFDCDSGNLMT